MEPFLNQHAEVRLLQLRLECAVHPMTKSMYNAFRSALVTKTDYLLFEQISSRRLYHVSQYLSKVGICCTALP